jgi:hypothetical protein
MLGSSILRAKGKGPVLIRLEKLITHFLGNVLPPGRKILRTHRAAPGVPLDERYAPVKYAIAFHGARLRIAGTFGALEDRSRLVSDGLAS